MNLLRTALVLFLLLGRPPSARAHVGGGWEILFFPVAYVIEGVEKLSRKTYEFILGDPAPLLIAAQNGDYEMVRKLLDSGKNANTTHKGESALIYAFKNRYVDPGFTTRVKIVKILIAAGADVEARDNEKKTALIWATERGSIQLVKTLVEAGADVNAICGYKQLTVLMYAANKGDVKVVKYLIENGADTESRYKFAGDQTVLMLTASSKTANSKVIMALIEAGADINARNSTGGTALMVSSYSAVPSRKVKLLIEAGAEVNAKDQCGETALFYSLNRYRWAPREERIKSIEYLIEAGADVNTVGRLGKTALMQAAFWGYWWAVGPLLEAGAKIDVEDEQGRTALLHAIANRELHDKTIRYLIEAGADVNVKGPNGMTPLIYVTRKGNKDLVDLLKKAGAKVDTNEKDSAKHSSTEKR